MIDTNEPIPIFCEDMNFKVRAGVCAIGFVARITPADVKGAEQVQTAARVSLSMTGMRALRDELTNLLEVLDRDPGQAIN